MKLHKTIVPKTIYHGRDKSITVDYVRGYKIEQNQFDFDIYIQKEGYLWYVNIGGSLAMKYHTLKELKYSVLSDLNARINDDRTAIPQIKWALTLLEYLEKNNGYADKDTINNLHRQFEKDN